MPLIPSAGTPEAGHHADSKGRHTRPALNADASLARLGSELLESIGIVFRAARGYYVSLINHESRRALAVVALAAPALIVPLLSVLLMAATTIGKGFVPQSTPAGDEGPGQKLASYLSQSAPVAPQAHPPPSMRPWPSPPPPPVAVLPPVPTLAPPPTPFPTLEPKPEPPPALTPPLLEAPQAEPPAAVTWGVCEDARSVNVVDVELTGVVQAGIDLLSEHFGCQKFMIDGGGLPVRFGEITPMFNAKVLGYAHSTPETYEIWLNRDCWGVVEEWGGVVAHELGHFLGWRHGDDHPYMWLAPPPGSYAQAGNAAIVCD